MQRDRGDETRPRGAAAAAVVLAACACVASPSIAAQEQPRRFELTPFAADRFGGEFEERDGTRELALDEGHAEGMIFDIRASTTDGQWEVLYAQQRTSLETHAASAANPQLELDITYLHFGGTYLFDGNATRPFLGATLGVTHFDPGLPGYVAETYLSGSLGGGVQLRADRRVGVRIEGRVFASILDNDGEVFCPRRRDLGGCALVIDATTLVEWEVRAGVVVRF